MREVVYSLDACREHSFVPLDLADLGCDVCLPVHRQISKHNINVLVVRHSRNVFTFCDELRNPNLLVAAALLTADSS